MSDCDFGTMDWCCCLQAGHDGPHQSEPLLPLAGSDIPVPARCPCGHRLDDHLRIGDKLRCSHPACLDAIEACTLAAALGVSPSQPPQEETDREVAATYDREVARAAQGKT